MKILAVDQATVDSGWVIIDKGKIGAYGVIHVPPTLDLEERVIQMTDSILKIALAQKVEYLVVEEIHGKRGRYNALRALAILRGALIYEWYRQKKEFPVALSCSHSRTQLGIKGNAKKPEVMQAVSKKFGLDITNEHIGDAIVLGIEGAIVLTPKTASLKPKRKNGTRIIKSR